MALSIRNARAEKLVREVAVESGENHTGAVVHALEKRLQCLNACRTSLDWNWLLKSQKMQKGILKVLEAARKWGMAGLSCMICGCAAANQPFVSHPPASANVSRTPVPVQGVTPAAPLEQVKDVKPCDTGWTQRVFTEDELAELYLSDPQLTTDKIKRILSRLNIRDRYLIGEDIRRSRLMKVPNDFRAYRNWSSMPTGLRS